MRAAFGLVGVLITVGVIVWFLSKGGGLDHTQQVLKSGETAREEASQFAGQDPETGQRASQSAELEGLNSGGKLAGLLVAQISAGGAYEKYFGLKRDDTIVAVEYQGAKQTMKDMIDEETARTHVATAYQMKGYVYVVRDEKEIRLPAVAPQAPRSAGEPKKDSGSPLQQQLDAIQTIPGAR